MKSLPEETARKSGRIYNVNAWRKAGYADSPAQKAFEETQWQMRKDPKGFLKEDAIEPVYPVERLFEVVFGAIISLGFEAFISADKHWRKSELSAKNVIIDTGVGAASGYLTRNVKNPLNWVAGQGINKVINHYKVKELIEKKAKELGEGVPTREEIEYIYQKALKKISARF
ncbi:MAG: hypothetical protein ACTSXQ_08040 [Alphaproteobacteria bacterium]